MIRQSISGAFRHTRRSLMATLVAVLGLVALLAPATALAGLGETMILRCTHGESLSGFSQSEYSEALSEISATTGEYTACEQLIRQAQVAAATGVLGAATGVPSLLAASPAERQLISHAARAGPAPVAVGGDVILPGVVRPNISSAVRMLPTPLLLLVVGLIAFIGLIAAGGLRDRVRARRTD
jgi:hypothetical protein